MGKFNKVDNKLSNNRSYFCAVIIKVENRERQCKHQTKSKQAVWEYSVGEVGSQSSRPIDYSNKKND
jgi:hypothetical protein